MFTDYNPAKTLEPINEKLLRDYSDDEMERNRKLEEAEWELSSLEIGVDSVEIPDDEKLFKDWSLEDHDKFKKPRDDKMK